MGQKKDLSFFSNDNTPFSGSKNGNKTVRNRVRKFFVRFVIALQLALFRGFALSDCMGAWETSDFHAVCFSSRAFVISIGCIRIMKGRFA